MTLPDAIGTVLGAIWAVVSSPIAVIVFAVLILGVTLFAFVGMGPAGHDSGFYEEFPGWQALVAWLVWAVIVIFAISLIVWATSSGSPFVWVAS